MKRCVNPADPSFDGRRLVNDELVGLREERVGELSPVGRQVFLQCAESCERALSLYANEVGMVIPQRSPTASSVIASLDDSRSLRAPRTPSTISGRVKAC